MFIERVLNIKKTDRDLISVIFDGPYYLYVTRWNKDNTMIRFNIETIHKDGTVTSSMIYGNEKIKRKDRNWAYKLYRIVMIQKTV